jgi:hypothetical protein
MRLFTNSIRALLVAAWAILLLSMPGCSNGTTAVPTGEVARKALEAALNQWRDGGKPGDLPGTDPKVEVHDTPWAKGDRLASYEILGEESGTAEKRFSVRLSLSKPEKVQEVKYHVLGVGPVMIFRDEDYERNINMVDGPPTEKAGSRAPGSRRGR